MNTEKYSSRRETRIEAHLGSVYCFCLRLCGGRIADAEDLTQDVFVQAWQNHTGFAGRAKMTTWLMRIALNRYLRLRDRSTTRNETSATDIEQIALPDPADHTLERLELARALDDLPDSLRMAFLLVKVEGCKYREAAEILDVPCGTVQWQVHEAVQRLRTTLLTDSVSSPAEADRSITPEVSHAM